jgi:hypothetical protein
VSPPRETWIAKLIAAESAEAEALKSARRFRSDVAQLIGEAVADGVSRDQLARGILRHRLGHAPSVEERRREVERLKKRRRRGTACPPEIRAGALKQPRSGVGSTSEVNQMSERLIRRKTIEEEFVTEEPEEKDDDLDCDDDKKAAAAAGDEDDDEDGEEEDEEDEDEDE